MITFCKFLESKKVNYLNWWQNTTKIHITFLSNMYRITINRKIVLGIEKNIVRELKVEKDLIESKEIPIKYYNYNYK